MDDSVRKYFNFDNEANCNKCLVENCIKNIKGNLKYNLKRHIVTNHKEVAKNEKWVDDESDDVPKKKLKKTVKVALDAETVKKACVEMVTLNALPLKIMEHTGFKRIMQPIADALNLRVSPALVKNDVLRCGKQMREIVSAKLQNRMICLKMDSATRHQRNVLGINVQYIDEQNKIQIHTLAMLTIEKRQTAENLKIEVLKVLDLYNIKLWQIYSVTVDNGANMLKSVELLKTLLNELLNLDDEDENISGDTEADANIDEQEYQNTDGLLMGMFIIDGVLKSTVQI